MMHARLIILAVLWLVGCAPTAMAPLATTDHLLSGQLLFNEEIGTSGIDSSQVLAINDEMSTYVRETVRGHPHARARINRLVKGMIDDGLLTMDYDANNTFTAIETFERRQGNCLSFSILFSALAREANLDAKFQMVDIPPSFRSDGEMILLDNHINVRVYGLRKDMLHTSDYVVDFNNAEYKGNYRTKKVDDEYALALYFSNVAVERMRKGEWRSAFRYLKKGIETDPEIAGLWVNLGVMYSRNERPDIAAEAYQQALSIHPSNRSALMNLATVLNQLGREEEADYYSRKAAYYKNRHPYYHYSLAQTAYEEGRSDDAMEHLADAIRLKDDEHQFYYLRGLVYEERTEYDRAAGEYTKAKDLAHDSALVAGYDRKLDALQLIER